MLSRAIKSIKSSVEKPAARRMANTEKYVGGRGAGETQLAMDRQKIRNRIAELRVRLAAAGFETF